MGGGGGTNTTTTKSDPWSGAQPYLTDVMQQAQNVYNQSANNKYFPGSTVVPFSPTTNQAMNMITDRASAGSPTLNAANSNVAGIMGGQGNAMGLLNNSARGEAGIYDQNVLSYLTNSTKGQYLDPTQNPAFQTMMGDVTGQVNSQFGAAGRTGAGMHEQTLARGLAQGASGLYDQERNRQQAASGQLQNYMLDANRARQSAANSYLSNQLQAAGMAPSLASAGYNDANAMLGVGQMQDDLGARTLQDQIDRYMYAQNLPLTNLQNYSGIINGFGGLGGTSSTTEPKPKSNTFGQILGGGIGLASLFL